MSLEKALVVVGFTESEAKVLASILEREQCTAQELIEETGLSRGTVYKALSNLIDQNHLKKSGTRPVYYSSTTTLTRDVKDQLDGFYKEISAKLKKKRIIESHVILRNICTIFEKNGYAIRETPKVAFEDYPLGLRTKLSNPIDKIAEGEYTFGISLIDKRKKMRSDLPKELLSSYLSSDILRLSRELNCITAFVFIHADRRDQKTLYRYLERRKKRRLRFPFAVFENFGIERNRLFIFRTDRNLEEKVSSAIKEIHQRRIVTSNMARMLKEKINEIQELILLSQEHMRRIDNLMITKKPFEEKRVIKAIDEIADPIRRIKNREKRNMGIFRRKFSENEVRINQYLDSIERRIFLPEVAALEKDLTELENIHSKFKPIEYELSDLYSSLFRYGVQLTAPREARINPFIFTEPYEKEDFSVDQESMKEAANRFSKTILEDLPNFFQIVTGEAGTGKTHAIRYIYGPILEQQKIKALYVDCPLNYDLIAGVFQELTQESLYPKQFEGAIRELRRSVPSTARELLRIVNDITDIWKNQGYKGMLLVLDELENTLPYAFLAEEATVRYQPPLALRQLREILLHRITENLGVLISCRSKIYPLLKTSLGVENLENFTYVPEKLGSEEFVELIEHRYKMWNISKGPIFNGDTLDEIIEITGGNTRDVIKYCRELFKFAVRSDLSEIDKTIIKKVGAIPLFRY